MPLRTMTTRIVTGNPARSPDAKVDLTAMAGIDILDEFESWAKSVPVDHFKNPVNKSYGHKPTVYRFGRVVVLEMRTGHYGIEGEQVIETKGFTDQYTTSAEDASTTLTRCALFVPPGSTTGLFFTERQGHDNCGTRVYDSFELHIKEKKIAVGKLKNGNDAHLVLDAPALVLGEAWMEAADLEEVSVIQYTEVSDVASTNPALAEEVIYTSSFKPKRGKRTFPQFIKDSVTGTKEDAIEFLTVVDVDKADDDYEVEVRLGDGVQSRRFLVGKTRTPVMRHVLSADGEPPLKLDAIVEEVGLQSKYYFENHLQLGWGQDWITPVFDLVRD